MSKIASYGCLAVPGVNQVSKMRPDDTGYYKCIVGAFNCENSSGVPYPLTDSVRSLFAEGGIVRRRLDKGVCRGEYAHPNISNMQPPDIIRRLARIDENQVSTEYELQFRKQLCKRLGVVIVIDQTLLELDDKFK